MNNHGKYFLQLKSIECVLQLPLSPTGYYLPITQICLSFRRAVWISWMFGRFLSKSDLKTSLRRGWLLMMALEILQKHRGF